jgi:hypothetical protein
VFSPLSFVSVGVSVDAQTAQLLLHGMGELHLEVVHDRLVRDFGLSGASKTAFWPRLSEMKHIHVPRQALDPCTHIRKVEGKGLIISAGVTMSSVRIAYKEGVRSAAEVTSEWSRELPGTGQTIASTTAVRVEPSPAGGGAEMPLLRAIL